MWNKGKTQANSQSYTGFTELKNISDNVHTEDDDLCGICLTEIEDNDTGVTQCGHIFCYECLKLWTNKKNNCPYCKKVLDENDVYLLSYDKINKEEKKIPKNDKELIDKVGTKLAHLIFYIRMQQIENQISKI